MAALGKIIGGLLFLAFIAINGTAIWRMEQFSEMLEDSGSATPSTVFKAMQGVDLTRDDVYRPAKLTEEERVEHAKVCVGDDRYSNEFCDCLVNGIEDRTTGMQFQLAMLAVQRSSGEDSLTKLPQLGTFSKAAASHGMTLDAFKQDVLATRDAVKAARKQCSHKG